MKDLFIYKASKGDLQDLALLFDDYRVFYKAKSDIENSAEFMKSRLYNGDSEIFIARRNKKAFGFVQLYPSFSSVSMSKVFILNDLFIDPNERGVGIGKLLISHAIDFAEQYNCTRISLSTTRDNKAQQLYEIIGFKESSYKFYNFNLPRA